MNASTAIASLRASEAGGWTGAVLFYDGECGLCNRLVRLLLRLDHSGRLRYAPLQGAAAQAYLRTHGLPAEDFDSLVFVPSWAEREKPAYQLRTDGVLGALRLCGGVGRALVGLRVVPRVWRDAGYRAVARWRYRIFGPWRPRPLARAEWAERFL